MIKKIIFLPIETVERELDGKMLLADEALSRGYAVCIGYYLKLASYAEKVGTGFYLYKAHTDYRATQLFKPLQDHGVTCGALDEEGLVFPNFDFYIRTRLEKGLSLQYLEHLFTWGDIQKTNIENRFPEYKDKIKTIGNPRIDLLREPFTIIFQRKAKKLRSKYGNFVLVNTNFGIYNYAPVFKISYIEHVRAMGLIKTDADEVFYNNLYHFYEKTFHSYVTAIKNLARDIYPTNIVIRPHPSENHQRWRDEMKGLRNVRVIFKGNVVNWLSASACMIHTGCTTGIEAFILGKPVIRFNEFPEERLESDLPNSLGENISSREVLVNRVKGILSGTAPYTINETQKISLNQWIKNSQGDFSSPQLMDIIDTHCDSEFNTMALPPKERESIQSYISMIKKWIVYALVDYPSIARAILGEEKYKKKKNRKQRYSGFPIGRIKRTLTQLAHLRPFSSSYKTCKIERITPDIILLTPKK